MRFSISIGGLVYNIESLTNDFFIYHAKLFECIYSNNGYSITVTKDILNAYQFSNINLCDYQNETLYILDKVIRHCLDYNRMIIHGSAISYKENAYLFIAPSGTGKTTHTQLWEKYLNDEVTIINGDKPMLVFDDLITVCGTPWNGKENFGTNISKKLSGIVLLKQSNNNSFKELNSNEALSALLLNCFYSIDKECGPKVANYISTLINKIPIYELECDISKEAFKTCFKGLTKTEYLD